MNLVTFVLAIWFGVVALAVLMDVGVDYLVKLRANHLAKTESYDAHEMIARGVERYRRAKAVELGFEPLRHRQHGAHRRVAA